MKNIKKSIFIMLIIIAASIIIPKITFAASDFTYKSMDFDVQVNEDGSMDVVETWTINIDGETNTLFKNFELDKEKFSSISDVKVTEVNNNGKEKGLKNIKTEMYHVTTDAYYALEISGEKFEIAWGVNEDSGKKIYKMYYTVNDCVKSYNDCAELYWKFVNDTSGNQVGKVNGVIKLPNKVSNIDNLLIWGHGDIDGKVSREDEKTITFNAKNYNSKYLELRMVVTEEDVFPSVTKINVDKLQEIKEYEKELAERENLIKIIKRIVGVLFIVIIYLINIAIFVKALKKREILKNNPVKKPTQKLEYFRDFPRKDATPAQVAFLHYFNTTKAGGTVGGRVIAATMLDLCLKKYLKFEMQANKDIKVILDIQKDTNELKQTESFIFEILKRVSKDSNTFTMKEFEKYAKREGTSFYNEVNKINNYAESEEIELENFNKEEKQKGNKYILSAGLSIFALIFEVVLGINILLFLLPIAIVAMIPAYIFLIYSIIISSKVSSRFNGLTQKGVDEQEKIRALKKYMEEFSLMKEKEVPELVLWEKYLVYATTMGIAERVIKQLKIVYPQFENDSLTMSNTSYLFMMSNSNFGNSFLSSVNKAYISSTPASSSGGGGGFSGGGRWRRRWRLQWRTLKINNKKD